MNKERRKIIKRGYDLISEGKDLIESALGEEQQCYDNLAESFQCGQQGDDLQENIDSLQECVDNAEEALNAIETLL